MADGSGESPARGRDGGVLEDASGNDGLPGIQPSSAREDAAERWPAYAYHPGRHPHPRRDPRGHSHGTPEPEVGRLDPDRLASHPAWQRARDLFDAGYWWESHEWLEALWRALAPQTPEGRLMKALMQAAAGQLRRAVGSEAGARRLLLRAAEGLAGLPERVADVRVRRLAAELGALGRQPRSEPLSIPMAGREEAAPPLRGRSARDPS